MTSLGSPRHARYDSMPDAVTTAVTVRSLTPGERQRAGRVIVAVVTYEVRVDECQGLRCVVRDEAADDSALAVEVLIDEVDASVTNHADHRCEGHRFRARDLPTHLQDGIAAKLSNGHYAVFHISLR